MNPHLAALLLGFVAGLRAATAPAVLWLIRYRSPAAYALGICALLEYVGDLYPRTPARTAFFGLTARVLSGAFCGWVVAAAGGASGLAGAFLGAVGAIAGAYLGLAARTGLTALIGRVAAALLEDAIAAAGAVAIVLSLR